MRIIATIVFILSFCGILKAQDSPQTFMSSDNFYLIIDGDQLYYKLPGKGGVVFSLIGKGTIYKKSKQRYKVIPANNQSILDKAYALTQSSDGDDYILTRYSNNRSSTSGEKAEKFGDDKNSRGKFKLVEKENGEIKIEGYLLKNLSTEGIMDDYSLFDYWDGEQVNESANGDFLLTSKSIPSLNLFIVPVEFSFKYLDSKTILVTGLRDEPISMVLQEKSFPFSDDVFWQEYVLKSNE